MIKTAVVILNWNGEVILRQFLPSVIACSRLEGTEIYVADNASTDASCEVVEKEFPSVRLIRLESVIFFWFISLRNCESCVRKYV